MLIVYDNDRDNTVRYTLGRIDENASVRPMFWFGINPSTAEPNKPDQTITMVYNSSERFGSGGTIMFNVYPQRATNPNEMHMQADMDIHRKNLEFISKYIQPGDTVVAAWGNHINKRPYLKELLPDIMYAVETAGGTWKRLNNLTKIGNPRHPLYQPVNSQLYPFDSEEYRRRFLGISRTEDEAQKRIPVQP